jgi:hypothetical protein
MDAFKDKNEKEIKVGSTVLVPCRVIKLAGSHAPLVHLESLEAYGHENANIPGPLKGRTKTAFWAEPTQVEVEELKS